MYRGCAHKQAHIAYHSPVVASVLVTWHWITRYPALCAHRKLSCVFGVSFSPGFRSEIAAIFAATFRIFRRKLSTFRAEIRVGTFEPSRVATAASDYRIFTEKKPPAFCCRLCLFLSLVHYILLDYYGVAIGPTKFHEISAK